MCKSDLSNPACARLSVHCLRSVDLGQEDLVVLNLTSGIAAAAAAVSGAAPLCHYEVFGLQQFLEILALHVAINLLRASQGDAYNERVT